MIKKIAKSIRWKNVFFIAIIQFITRYFIIKPVLNSKGLEFLLSDIYFLMLVVSTMLIAAAGYLINDYFDYEHDLEFNKRTAENLPSKNLLFRLYIIFNIVAFFLAFWVSFACGMYKISFIAVIVAGLLWFYSSNYKKSFLIGNLIVAIVSALVPIIIMIFELFLQYNINKNFLISIGQNLHEIRNWVLIFSFLSFWFTVIREIVKDTEDFEADLAYNYNTIPLILGRKTTKIIVSVLTILGIILIVFGTLKYLPIYPILYIIVIIIVPLILFIMKLFKSNEKEDFKFLSIFLKLIMFAAILYPVFFNILNLK